MKKILFWLLLPVLSGIISCKKDDPTPPPAAVKFMSFTAGSTWNYKVTNNPSTTATPVTNYTLTATSNDSAASSKTYKVFTNSTGPNEYYNITGSDYYTYRKLPADFGGASVEVLYLKDNLAVGDTWNQTTPITYSGFTLQLTFNNTIAQKGITKVVNGVTYNDVTDVQTSLAITGIPFPNTLTSTIHYYYAPKFGQIANDTKIDLTITGVPPTNFEQKTELQSATIL